LTIKAIYSTINSAEKGIIQYGTNNYSK
jgi:hypothetical protein